MQRKTHDTVNVEDEVVPFYFETSSQRLYGCHHLPQGSRGKSFAIVICSAIGQEYLRSHRAIYQLAVLLSRAGFHVLRFDYFGCGDSEGEFEQGSIVQWTKDIHAAVEQIQNRSGQTRVYFIGLRMGATLALKAAVDCRHVDGIVLWEPVLLGNRYLQELAEAHCDFLNAWRHKIKPAVNACTEIPEEVLGFPITSEMRHEIESIEVNGRDLPPGVRLLAVLNCEGSDCVTDLNRIKEKYFHAEVQMISEQTEVWKEFYRRLTPHRTLQYIVKWIDSLEA